MEHYDPNRRNSISNVTVNTNVFLVRIQFRQNASWQGTIQWLDSEKTRTFRSFLEMTMLIQEALDKAEPGEPGKFRSWDDKDEAIPL